MTKIKYFQVKIKGDNYSEKVLTKDAEDLKPCPFCGKEVKLLSYTHTRSTNFSRLDDGCRTAFLYELVHPVTAFCDDISELKRKPTAKERREYLELCHDFQMCPFSCGVHLDAGTVTTDPRCVETFIKKWNRRAYEKESEKFGEIKWIKLDGLGYKCPNCGKIVTADDSNELHYCCNCGKKMS